MKLRDLILMSALMGSTVPVQLRAAEPAATPKPTKEQIDSAAFAFKVMMSALHSEKIEPPIKEALFACIYSNPMSKISEAVSKIMVERKLDKNNAEQVLAVMAGICGYHPQPAAAQPKK